MKSKKTFIKFDKNQSKNNLYLNQNENLFSTNNEENWDYDKRKNAIENILKNNNDLNNNTKEILSKSINNNETDLYFVTKTFKKVSSSNKISNNNKYYNNSNNCNSYSNIDNKSLFLDNKQIKNNVDSLYDDLNYKFRLCLIKLNEVIIKMKANNIKDRHFLKENNLDNIEKKLNKIKDKIKNNVNSKGLSYEEKESIAELYEDYSKELNKIENEIQNVDLNINKFVNNKHSNIEVKTKSTDKKSKKGKIWLFTILAILLAAGIGLILFFVLKNKF